MSFGQLLIGLVYLVAVFILVIIGKLVLDAVKKNYQLEHELFERDNVALALSVTGYYLGLVFALGGAIIGPSEGLWMDLLDLALYGALAIVLLNVSAFLNDKLILYSFSNEKEIITDRNLGTGAIEAANFIAVGLIVSGAIGGEGGGILSALVFWALGQAALILVSLVYARLLPFDLHAEIERNNVAVGVAFAGLLLGLGNLVRLGISGDFISWQADLQSAGLYVLVGLILMPLIRLATDRLLLPGVSLSNELVQADRPNVGAGLIEAFAYIAASILIGWTI